MEQHDDNTITEEEILTTVSVQILLRLALAMGLHPRLNENSLFRLLDPGIIILITNFVVPEFSAHPYWCLCQEIMYDYHVHGLEIAVDGFTFSINLNSAENFYVSLADDGPNSDEEDAFDADNIATVCVYLRHPSLLPLMQEPADQIFDPEGQNLLGIRMHDPRNGSYIDDMEYTACEAEEKACYTTRSYNFPAEKAAIRNVVDLALGVILSSLSIEEAADNGANHNRRLAHLSGG